MVRIYPETAKKKAIALGLSGAFVSVIALMLWYSFLPETQALVMTGLNWTKQCAGTEQDLCWTEYDFYALNDTFWYPTEHDPWGRNTPFEFSEELEDWKFVRSWGEYKCDEPTYKCGWKTINLSDTCKGTWCGGKYGTRDNKYSIAWREAKKGGYKVRVYGYKTDMTQDIDVSFNPTVTWKGVKIDYKLISFNTDITTAEMIFRFKIDKNYIIDSSDKFTTKFKSATNFKPKNWDFYLYKNESYEVNRPIWDSNCSVHQTLNGTNYTVCNPFISSWNNYTAHRDKWNKFNPVGKTIQKDKWYGIKLVARKEAVLGFSSVDVVPSFGGFDISEWAWWNTTYGYCINVTGNSTDGTAREYELMKVLMNSSVWSNAPYEDSIRVVNALCEDGGSEIPNQLTNVTLNGNDYSYVDVSFLANRSADTAFEYSIYWSDSDQGSSSEGSNITVTTTGGGVPIQVESDNFDFNITNTGAIPELYIDGGGDWTNGLGFGVILKNTGTWVFGSGITNAVCEVREQGNVFAEVWCTRTSGGVWYNKFTVPKTGYYFMHDLENSAWGADKGELWMHDLTPNGETTNWYFDYYGAASSLQTGWTDITADRSWFAGYSTDSDRYYGMLMDDREDTDYRKARYLSTSELVWIAGRTVSADYIIANTTNRHVFPYCTSGTCAHADIQTVVNSSFTEYLNPLSVTLAAEQSYLVVDTTPPKWYDNSTNGTTAGAFIEHRVRWTDETALSGFIFEFCNGTHDSGNCGGSGSSEEDYEDFESGWGNWTSWETGDCIAWQRGTSTVSSGTGPQSGGVGGSGTYFVYVETSSAGSGCYYDGDTNYALLSRAFAFGGNTGTQIIFHHHKHGTDPGNLSLWENTTGSWVLLWYNNTNNADVWYQETVDLTGLSGTGQLRFRNVASGGYLGDTALDRPNVTVIGTGSVWVNDTWAAMPASNWTNVSKWINTTAGADMAWRFYCNDTYDNWNLTDTFTYTASDITPPNIDFISPTTTNGTEASMKDYVTWNVSVNEDIGFCKIEINNTNQTGTIVNSTTDSYYHYNETGLSMGVTRCAVGHATDASDNWNTTSNTICRTTVDATPPNVDFISPTDSNGTEAENKTYVTWNISVSEDVGLGKIEINGTNQTATCVNDTTDSYCYYNETGLTGNQTRCAYGHATDALDNWNTTLEYICRNTNEQQVDVEPPELDFTSPTLGNTTTTTNDWIYVNVSADETLDTCLLDWNLASNVSMTVDGSYCYKNQTSLGDASYYFRVYGNDTSGNLNVTEDREITLDATLPTITIYSPENITYNYTSLSLDWSYDESLDWVGYSLNGGPNITLQTNSTHLDNPDITSCNDRWAADPHACNKVYDNDWNTYGEKLNSDASPQAQINITYYKPRDAINVTWQVKGGTHGYTGNITIPSGCFDQSSTEIFLQIESVQYDCGVPTCYGYRYYCWDGSWNNLEGSDVTDSLSANDIYEEMTWWSCDRCGEPMNITITTVTGQNNITIYANDTAGNMNLTTVYFWVSEYNITYEYPSGTTDFELNISSGNLTFNYTHQTVTWWNVTPDNQTTTTGIHNVTIGEVTGAVELDNVSISVSLNASVPSCMKFYLSNTSSTYLAKDTTTALTLSTAQQIIYSTTEINISRHFWEWVDMDNCTVPLTFDHTLNFTVAVI